MPCTRRASCSRAPANWRRRSRRLTRQRFVFHTREFLGGDPELTARFAGSPEHPFTVEADGPASDRLQLGLGVTAFAAGAFSACLQYDAFLENGAATHQVNAGMDFRF